MRILAVNWLDRDNPQAGGAEVHFFELFERLVLRGHEVTLICSGFDDAVSVVRGPVQVRRIGGRYSFALKGRGAVRRALAEHPYDVVVEDINKLPLYLPMITTLPVYAIVPHLFGTTVFREASLPMATVVWLAERCIPLVYRRAAFHAISRSTKDDLVGRGIAAERIRVIHPGVDADWYTPGGTRAADPTFLYVGRVKRYKGIDTAIAAVGLAGKQGVPVTLQIAGSGDDRARLERLVSRLGLRAHVTFVGFVAEDEKRRLMREAWAVVLPSAKEGWGLTNVEGAACGTPALAADRPGLTETVLDGETGYLFPHGNAERLAARFIELARDASLVERMGRAGRRFAESLSWDRAADETEAHLIETLRKASSAQ